jgi:ABC-type phosphate transport system substrate-binding protein
MVRRLVLLTLGLAAGGALAPPALAAQARTLVAIVNRNRPENGLSRDQLVQIFRGELRFWPANRDPIQLALPPGSPQARNDFIRKVLQMTPTEWDREWQGKRYRGETAIIPRDLTRTEVMQAVLSQPRFLAVVELEWFRTIDASQTRDMKILQIDGKNPGEADYPLRLSLLWLHRTPLGLLARHTPRVTRRS